MDGHLPTLLGDALDVLHSALYDVVHDRWHQLHLKLVRSRLWPVAQTDALASIAKAIKHLDAQIVQLRLDVEAISRKGQQLVHAETAAYAKLDSALDEQILLIEVAAPGKVG